MSDRITPAMISGSALRNIESSMNALDRSSEELSSGRSILEPSDNPFGAGRAIDLQSTLDGLSSYESNVQETISLQNTASSALTSIGDVVARVREIALQGANGANNEGDLENLAVEVEQLTESVKADANVQYAGSYILSGTQTETPPYELGAEDAYHGNEGAIARAIGPGATVQIGMSASTLLGEGQGAEDGKLLDVLRTVAANLREGTTEAREALGGADLEGIEASSQTLTAMQSRIGSVIDQLRTAEGRIEELQVTTAGALSNTQNANIAKVSIEYASQQAGYEAALRAGASIVQMSLLEFLK
jgi:flagellar hook-associated protein 3 FlgL